MFLKRFWKKSVKYSRHFQSNIFLFFCHARQRLFSAMCAVTVVPHMQFCVRKFKHHGWSCYFITWLIVLLIYNFVVYQHFIFSDFNLSWIFSKQFLSIVVTLQVSLHIIFKWVQPFMNVFVYFCYSTSTPYYL